MAETILPAVVLLGAGLLAILASRAVRLSPIVGFLVAGLVVGEHGLGLIAEGHTTHLLAELGVVFLLFDIGLHFSLRDALERRRDILGLGPAQVVSCAAVLGALALALGVGSEAALLVGAALALSSTAVVARVLAERGQQTCPIGRSATAVLIFQDVAAIFLLVLVAAPPGAQAGLAPAALDAAWKTVAAVALALALGRVVARPLFRTLAGARNEELFTGAALFIVLAMAWATASIGLSLTLGAFLAGMMIADSPYRHLIQTEARPFRNLLLGFFFMSVGMALEPGVLLGSAHWVIAGVLVLLVVKTSATFAAAKGVGWTNARATQLAFLMAQGSEFALVVFASVAVSEALGPTATSILVAVVAVSLALTPAWASAGARLSRRLAERGPASAAIADTSSSADAVIVFGMNAIGRFAVDALEQFEIPAIAVETDPERFLQATAEGYEVAFGDLADLRLADAIGATHARALVLSVPRLEVSRELTPIVRERYPNLRRYVALSPDADTAPWRTLGIRAVAGGGEPRGVELATALLRDAEIDETSLSEWLEELRNLEPAGEPASEVQVEAA